MSLNTQNLNYSIATGNTTFAAVPLATNEVAIAVLYNGINTSDVEVYLEQSVDGSNWNEVPTSTFVLDKTAPSHMWNLVTKAGMHVRVGLRRNTATAGTIDIINTLT